jgi:hypothetical protein
VRYFIFVVFILFFSWAFLSEAAQEKTIPCDDKRSRPVRVAEGRLTTINFPFKPKDVVPGKLIFDFKQIKNDLLISALRSSGRTNVVVYLENRRCSFDLTTVQGQGDDILIVKDPKDSQYEVKSYE